MATTYEVRFVVVTEASDEAEAIADARETIADRYFEPVLVRDLDHQRDGKTVLIDEETYYAGEHDDCGIDSPHIHPGA
jgi:hypothetical protein